MLSPDSPSAFKASPRALYERLAITLAVASIVVAIVLSIRSERTTSLTLRYLAQRPLLETSAAESQGLRVSHGNVAVERPFLFTARLENTGDLPIEASHIEVPLTIHFDSARVLGADITLRSPADLEATLVHDSLKLTVTHGLLNPADWLAFDILLDGDPGSPRVTGRISGVAAVKIVPPGSPQLVASVTRPTLPKPLQYVAAVLALVFGFILTGAGFLTLYTFAKACLVIRTHPNQPGLAALLAGDLAQVTRLGLPMDEALRTFLSAPADAPVPLPASLQGSNAIATFRAELPHSVGAALYRLLPSGVDGVARGRVSQLAFDDHSTSAFMQRVVQTLSDIVEPDGRIKAGIATADKQEAIIGAVMLPVGMAITMLGMGALKILSP